MITVCVRCKKHRTSRVLCVRCLQDKLREYGDHVHPGYASLIEGNKAMDLGWQEEQGKLPDSRRSD